MPTLSDHHSSDLVKLLYIGDSGTGKTGSLTSLACAGYKLRVLDLDNGLDSLVHFVRQQCPAALAAVDFETRRDTYKASRSGPVLRSAPRAFMDSLELLTKWSDGSDPAEWGSSTIFVLDSGTALGKAAYEWARGMNPGSKDPRQWYFQAQQAFENVVSLLTCETFRTNVIVISHVLFKEMPDGSIKGYPNTIGSALGPTIPKYFNTLILSESVGSGKNVRRRIKTVPTGIIDLKNPAPFKVDQELPLESGLATLFHQLTGKDHAEPKQRLATV